MESKALTSSLTTAEVMTRWPRTIPIFLRHSMACVGCPISRFETLAEITAIYNLNPDSFIRELQQAIQSPDE